MDVRQNQCYQKTYDHLDDGDGDVDKLVNNRGSHDAGQNDEYKLKCLQQASVLVLDGSGAAGSRQPRANVASRDITLLLSIYGFAITI